MPSNLGLDHANFPEQPPLGAPPSQTRPCCVPLATSQGATPATSLSSGVVWISVGCSGHLPVWLWTLNKHKAWKALDQELPCCS